MALLVAVALFTSSGWAAYGSTMQDQVMLECPDGDLILTAAPEYFDEALAGQQAPMEGLAQYVQERWPRLDPRGFQRAEENADRIVFYYEEMGLTLAIAEVSRSDDDWLLQNLSACNSLLLRSGELP